jgi:hypothetical protein
VLELLLSHIAAVQQKDGNALVRGSPRGGRCHSTLSLAAMGCHWLPLAAIR